ncbi:hypothetical protein O6H91_16G006500 [Diphasiastrum complanatum]|uniref:Uncharacterized protein n=1 Tax=Diphasiastrum complanatum TaxID=34168 RepID=A0ACC2B9J7_DIPCM|nr:hypothetical protein O6H91_16G006500 [Diphasiastrum complanatum]
MGNCCSDIDYITPRPKTLLPDPAAPSTFSASRNAFLSNNFNVFKGTDGNKLLWLFLHAKGKANGIEDSYFVLENFWRAPYSEEGDVLCWCRLPAYHRTRCYCSSGHEEYGISQELNSKIYWANSRNHAELSEAAATPTVLWKRTQWQFSLRLGFYGDRYMEEPLGSLEISITGWIVKKVGGPGKNFARSKKEVKDARYVFRDKHGQPCAIELDVLPKGGNSKVISYQSSMFGCVAATPSHTWLKDQKMVTTTRAGHDPGLAFLVAFMCANVVSPHTIAGNLKVSELGQKSISTSCFSF